MSAKRMRTFWPFSPCPEAHHEVSPEDNLLKAVRVRMGSLSVEEIVADLGEQGFTTGEIHNAIQAITILDGQL